MGVPVNPPILMLSFTIDIPQNIVDKLTPILDKQQKPPRVDPETGNIIIEKQFPNGVPDWVQAIIGANISGLIGPDDEDIKAMQAQMDALREQMRTKFQRDVQVSVPAP